MTDHHQPHPTNGAAPTPGKGDEAENGSTSEIDFKPVGIKSPRQIRALQALLDGPTSRERLDQVAGASNSPDVVAALRRRGLGIVCDTVEIVDRDGRKAHPGVYSLHPADRPKAINLLKCSEVAE